MNELLAEDRAVLASLQAWCRQDLDILVTGGTGFVGNWLVRALALSGRARRLTLISREPSGTASLLKSINDEVKVEVFAPSVLSEIQRPSFDEVWHMSAATGTIGSVSWREMYAADVEMMTKLLSLAERQLKPPRFVYTSSGAVYGRGRTEIMREDSPATLVLGTNANLYDVSKQMSETLLTSAGREAGIDFRIARLFAFVGPYLPLDKHFAIGNFINHASRGKTIELKTEGRDLRSWMYPTDLLAWLFRLADQSEVNVLNVGSSEILSIRECAELVGRIARVPVKVPTAPFHSQSPTIYAPDVSEARSRLGLQTEVDLASAIKRTLRWLASL